MMTLLRSPARVAVLAAAFAGMPSVAQAEEPVGPKLTPELRGVLNQEMALIDEAMRVIHGSLVQGDHDTVAEQAQAIHDSFILHQELTEEDRRTLKAAVPEAFIQLDRRFHEEAAELADAARAEETGQQVLRFQRMTGTCLECHARFASDRFPRLEGQEIPWGWDLDPRKE